MKKKATEMTIPFEAEQVVESNTNTVAKATEVSEPVYPDNVMPIFEDLKEYEIELRKDYGMEPTELYGAAAYKRLFESSHAPKEPKRRPKYIRDITEPAPQNAQTAAGQFTLTAFATYADNVNFPYNDNSLKELRMNEYVAGENGIGKKIVKTLVDAILRLIDEEDEEGWKTDKKYRKAKEAAGDKKTEERPAVKIRIINPNITKPELNQLGDESEGKPLFMHVQEPDELDTLKGGQRGRQHFEILKKSDDENNTAGQMRAGTKSISAKYNLRLQYVIEIRPTQLLGFFNGEIINGARDRASICEILPLEDKHKWPKMGNLGEEYQAKIRPYIENIKAAKGTIVCKRANKLIDKLRNEFFDYYDETQDDVLELMTHRALCRAFRRACLCYIASGQKWDPALDKWIRWSFMYDMWQQFHYFYDAIRSANNNLKCTKQGPPSLSSELPIEFTFTQLKELYIKLGFGDDEKKMHGIIRTWLQRKKIERTETGYRQLK